MTSADISVGTITIEGAGWIGGCDSLKNPWLLGPNQYRWGVNIINRGGVVQTRPGRELRLILPPGNLQGGIIFYATKQVTADSRLVRLDDYYLVLVVSGLIYAVPFNEDGALEQPLDWRNLQLRDVSLDANVPIVYLATPERAARRVNGALEVVSPHNVLIIQDNVNGAVYWDGELVGQEEVPLDASNLTYDGIPVGSWMVESGDRLWVATKTGVMAADLKDPLSFSERLVGDTRGDFTFGSEVTGLADYHDADEQAVLVVFTATTRSILLSGIRNRSLWSSASGGFQRLLDPSVGCVSGRSVVFQGGLMNWWSAGGMVSLNPATQRYHTNEVPYQDMNMARTKASMSDNASFVCGAAFERFLLMSVPFEERLNSHTMVLDLGLRTQDSPPSWAGVWTGTRPTQWVTGEVYGVPRIFQLSLDYQSLNNGSHLHVWEEFCREQNDVYFRLSPDNTFTTYRRRIYCYFETALFGPGMDFKELKFVEFDMTKIAGEVDLNVSYRSLRGETGKMLEAKIRTLYFDYQLEGQQAAADAVKPLGKLLPQSRRLRTEEVIRIPSQQVGAGEVPKNADRAFSIVFEWCGQAGVDALSVVMLPYAEGGVGELSFRDNAVSALGEGGSIALALSPIGVEDLLPAPLDESWVSAKSASYSELCPDQSSTPGIVVTAEVIYRSYISKEDADSEALSLATASAQTEAARLRGDSPCTWQSFRYADRVCRPQWDSAVTDVISWTTTPDTSGVPELNMLVGPFEDSISTLVNGADMLRRTPNDNRFLRPNTSVFGTAFSNSQTRWVERGANRTTPASPPFFVPSPIGANRPVHSQIVVNESTSSTFNGISVPHIALFDAELGTTNTTPIINTTKTAALGTGPSGFTPPIAIHAVSGHANSTLFYVGGNFTTFNGSSRRGAIAINALTGAITAFNATSHSHTIVSVRGMLINARVPASRKLYAYVVLDSDTSELRLIQVDPDTGAYVGAFTDRVYAIVSLNERLRPHMTFDNADRVYSGYDGVVERLLTDGSVDGGFAAFTAPVGQVVTGVAVDGEVSNPNVFVSTSTSPSPNPTGSGRLHKLNTAGVDAPGWSVVANGTILGVKSFGSQYVTIHGDFTEVSGKPLFKFAYIDTVTGEPLSAFQYEVRSASAESLISLADANSIAQTLATQAVELALPCT
jgi:hypothetical protein